MRCVRQQILGTLLMGVVTVISFLSCRQEENKPAEVQPQIQYVLAAHELPKSGIWKSTPILADINRDGVLDLVVLPRLGSGAHVWLGNSQGVWTKASAGLQMDSSCGGGMALGDINRDSHLDLVVADHCAGVFVYVGDSHGHWQEVTRELNPSLPQDLFPGENDENPFLGAEDVALGDVNEDGHFDLVVAASNQGGFTVYLGDGSGLAWQEVTSPDGLPSGRDPVAGDAMQGGFANRLLLTDLDGDTHLDVVASYYAGPRVWRGDGKGHWQVASQGLSSPTIGGLIRSLAVGDINEDGRTDLVVANVKEGPEVYVQNQDGTWLLRPSAAFSALQRGVESVALGDLDGDGHLDLVAGGRLGQHQYSGISVFRGDGRASWSVVEQTQLPTHGIPWVWGITLGDINHDGSLDIVLSSGMNVKAGLGKPAIPFRTRPDTPGRAQASLQTGTPPQPELPRIQVWRNAKKVAVSLR